MYKLLFILFIIKLYTRTNIFRKTLVKHQKPLKDTILWRVHFGTGIFQWIQQNFSEQRSLNTERWLFLYFIGCATLNGQRSMKSLSSVCLSVCSSLNFLKIGSLVFSHIVHDDMWPWYLMTDEVRFLKKKTNWRPEFGPNTSQNRARN